MKILLSFSANLFATFSDSAAVPASRGGTGGRLHDLELHRLRDNCADLLGSLYEVDIGKVCVPRRCAVPPVTHSLQTRGVVEETRYRLGACAALGGGGRPEFGSERVDRIGAERDGRDGSRRPYGRQNSKNSGGDRSWTVIKVATGREHGPYDSEADVALCLVFEKLSRDEVEVIAVVSLMSTLTAPP